MSTVYLDYRRAISLLCLACVCLFPSLDPSAAMDLVISGKPKATIILPDNPLPVVEAAAKELQYHVRESTGATLPIVKESDKPQGANFLYLGACKETLRVGLKAEKLPANAFFIKLIGDSLFFVGNDSDGEPFWIQHENRSRVGTLFAVYEFLDQHLGVRWLWPGKLGEVIPKRSDLRVTRWDQTHVPQILHSRWRDGGAYSAGSAGWASPQARSQYLQDQGVWLRRQRFAMGVNMDICHSFTDYWKRFNTEHPEFFNLLPDGTRRPDPFYWGGDASLVSMCVSQPALWKQIISHWEAANSASSRRSPQIPFIDASENDTSAKCTCDRCLAWDVPGATVGDSPQARLAACRKAFTAGEAGWERHLGSLADRYARFYLEVQREARKVEPDATVMGLAYANYTEPPLKTKLNERITIAIVPALMFPWTSDKRVAFRKQWDGWRKAGVTLMLRPNYTLDGHNMPVLYAQKLGEDLSFAARRGLVATDFDSLTGQWAAQGPNLYVLGRLHAHPDWPAQEVLNEYYAGFGKASAAVRAYFSYWENLCDSFTDKTIERAVSERGAELGDWARFHRIAPSLFTPKVMAGGQRLLDKAKQAARGDSKAEERVAFLAKGFRHAELTLAVQVAFEGYRRSGDLRTYRAAMGDLDSFRAEVESDNIANMAYLAWAESMTWDRTLLSLMKEPGDPLPGPWKFVWDPQKRGEAENWQSEECDESHWSNISIEAPWERQEVGRRWKQEHGMNYDGIAWYRTRFNLKSSKSAQQIRLIFGAVDEACKIWLNGKPILDRPFPYEGNINSWQEAFEVDVTQVVRTDRPNVLAVRVEDNAGAGGVWKPVWLLQSDAPAAAGKNLVKNGGFEQSSSGWSNQTQCGDIAYALDTSQRHSGAASARLLCSALGPPEVEEKFKTRAWGRWYQPSLPVQPGRKYRMRLWIKTSKDFSGKVHAWATGDKEVGTRTAVSLNTEGLWKEMTMEGITPEGDEITLYLNLMGGTGTVWLDDVEVTEAEPGA